ncbi:nitroreductase family protein [Marinobacterium sp. BA1]|uniref:Acg family FMN-binding oxidoreductase n=1 Tax=Marinobacterium sp. BA1 TaxID=3138931 RepID=UPI0032E6D871
MDESSERTSLHALLQQAVLAPSSHNTQPWLFRLNETEQVVELLADRQRALPVNDPDNRELHISCGCALFNLRVAAADAGLSLDWTLLPKPETPNLLARVHIGRGEKETTLASLGDALIHRRTWRNRFKPEALSAELQNALCEAARAEHGHVQLLLDPELRQQVVELVKQGDSLLWQDETWREELARWMHPGRAGDGLTVPRLVAPLVRGVVRHFDMGKSMASQDRLLAEESPLLALLSSDGDTPRDWLQTGQALQHLLLVAQQQGVQASYLNQPIQHAQLRPQLEQHIGAQGHAQILLRLGYPDDRLPASPRRPLDDVIIE